MFDRRIKMSQTDLYNLCCRYHGQNVRITGRDGRVSYRKITRVNRDMVWILPAGNLGGYGLGFGGFGSEDLELQDLDSGLRLVR